jgi:hypothetical protein
VAVESGWVYWYHCRRFPHPGSGRVALGPSAGAEERRGERCGTELMGGRGGAAATRHGGRAWEEAGRAGRTRAEGVHGLLHRLRRTVWFVGYEINGVKRGRRIKVE